MVDSKSAELYLERPRCDSNAQSLVPKTNALSIRPRGPLVEQLLNQYISFFQFSQRRVMFARQPKQYNLLVLRVFQLPDCPAREDSLRILSEEIESLALQ